MKKIEKYSIADLLWNLWCVVSVVGIWPRFIEPNLIHTTNLEIEVPKLKSDAPLKIVQFSDLHLSPNPSRRFLNKLRDKILKEKADLIVFTGDFICFSTLDEKLKLKNFLNSLNAPYGCFAVLGNHDYENFVLVNESGEYDIIDNSNASTTLSRGFKKLFSNIKLKGFTTERAKNTDLHQELIDLVKETPFTILHNENKLIEIKSTKLNICGLGEYSLQKCLPEIAFKNYDANYPGIILSHNPDSLILLKDYPGEIILSGHTHGGQVNLPWFREKFMSLENLRLARGLVHESNKLIYINKGVGSVMKFRWFSMPEILVLKLQGKS